MLASVIITTFPFCLLALLEAKSPIFSFFLGNFLKAFPALHFYRELVVKISPKDTNPLNSEFFPLVLDTLPLNINKLHSIIIFKPLIFLKSNSRGIKVTSFSIDSFFLILTVEASTKS